MEAVDDYFPEPERALDKPFSLSVEDVFSIQGRGTVVTGRIEQGIIKVGDEVEVVGINPSIKSTVTGRLLRLDVNLFQCIKSSSLAWSRSRIHADELSWMHHACTNTLEWSLIFQIPDYRWLWTMFESSARSNDVQGKRTKMKSTRFISNWFAHTTVSFMTVPSDLWDCMLSRLGLSIKALAWYECFFKVWRCSRSCWMRGRLVTMLVFCLEESSEKMLLEDKSYASQGAWSHTPSLRPRSMPWIRKRVAGTSLFSAITNLNSSLGQLILQVCPCPSYSVLINLSDVSYTWYTSWLW